MIDKLVVGAAVGIVTVVGLAATAVTQGVKNKKYKNDIKQYKEALKFKEQDEAFKNMQSLFERDK